MNLSNVFSLLQPKSRRLNRRQQEYLMSYHYQHGMELHKQDRDADAMEEFERESRTFG